MAVTGLAMNAIVPGGLPPQGVPPRGAPPHGARDGQLIAGESLFVKLANFVKLPHTVFAMPFALVGVLFASAGRPLGLRTLGWVLLAFTAARFAAMGFNRIVDRDVDAVNPRTAMRELPRGTLTLGQARASVVVASLLFIFSASQINTLCFALSPIALLWVLGYSYTKRFTRWSHLWLGLGLSIAPVGGYLAITGMWSDPWWQIGVLALAVVAWSGGFDMLYALQDTDFDKREGLYSLPASIGVSNAIAVSRLLHAAAVLCLSIVVASNPLELGAGEETAQLVLWLGVAFVAAMLVWEHRLVRANDLSKLDAAFFTMNGVISLGFLGAVFVARLLADPDITMSMQVVSYAGVRA